MALTFTKVDRFNIGDRNIAIYDVLFDSSYPTGGEAVAKSDFGLRSSITHILPSLASGAAGVLACRYSASAGKLLLFYGDNNNAADGPLIQVPDTTDVSAYTARLVVIGK